MSAPILAQSTAPAPFPAPKAKTKPKPSGSHPVDHTPLSLFPVQALWTIDLNSRLMQAPAYDDRRGYFAIDQNRIVAYDLISGTRQWIVTAAPQMPLAAGGDLLFLVEPQMLTALRAGDGSIAWQLPFAEKLVVHPVWDNGWLIAATATNDILAFRASDGELIWRRAIGTTASAAPALAEDRVYIPTTDGRVIALRVETGEPVWERRIGGAASDILPLPERLYVGSKGNDFYCLLTRDGTIDWRWRTGADVIGTPVFDDHRVYFVALDNVLRALDRKNGGQRWKASLPLRPTGGLLMAGDAIIVTGVGPTMNGYNATDGKSAGDIHAPADLAAPPYIAPHGANGLPVLLAVTQDIAKGSTVSAVTRSVEPALAPLAPLTGVVPVRPSLPRSTPPS
ncbi:MAG TPA: PQQ-binding-like beta-propeller repeat protein [Vicinamibacterales bacterium]|nr:PQQ-binding-like beta-propeller repeat protein [Vicinamibacterales bacterium]